MITGFVPRNVPYCKNSQGEFLHTGKEMGG
jgi:hypothetical protein